MVISVITGFKGEGKTVFDVGLIHAAVKAGKRVYTNYTVSFPHEPLHMDAVMEDTRKLENSSVHLDEGYMYLDSRKFGSRGNILFSYLTLQSRHLGLDVAITAPQFSLIDVRERANTDYVYQCRAMRIKGGSLVRCSIEEMEAGLVDRILVSCVIVRETRLVRFLFDPRPYFDMYDTHEYVDITI